MLKTFYDINISENGTILKKEETENYESFQRVKNITTVRTNQTLVDEDKFFDSNFGSQPVIYLSFKDIQLDCIDSLKLLMINAFKTRPYLKISEKLTSEEKILFGKFFNAEVSGEHLIESSGGTLAKLLSKHFKKPCILLIDDFDEPAVKLLTNGSTGEEHNLKIIRNFVNGLFSDKKTVNRAFLTGKTRLAGMYTPPSVTHYQFTLHSGITNFFSVANTELSGLTMNATVLVRLFVLKDFYKGFTTVNSTYTLYDPKTVTELLESRNHSRLLDSVEFLAQVLDDKEVRDKVELAIRTWREPSSFYITAPKETDHERCAATLRKIFKHNASKSGLELDKPDRNCLFYYLFELGYVTFAVSEQIGSEFKLEVPDLAAYYSLGFQLERFWLGHLHTTNATAKDFVETLMNLDWRVSSFEAFADSVKMVFKECPHPPTSREDLRSPLFTFLATRVRDYLLLELRCGDDPDSGLVDLFAETRRSADHARNDVLLEFVLSNCTREDFDKNNRTKSWVEFIKTVDPEEYTHNKESLMFLVVEICFNGDDSLEFAFSHASKNSIKAHYVFREINRWKS
ncbi:uncharacterized protein [Bemisia tabaci]|uniref:uncharacterized protein n=1 Tax=Bemisia tabaci TaxID=7038 RepID=UPI003B28A92A